MRTLNVWEKEELDFIRMYNEKLQIKFVCTNKKNNSGSSKIPLQLMVFRHLFLNIYLVMSFWKDWKIAENRMLCLDSYISLLCKIVTL